MKISTQNQLALFEDKDWGTAKNTYCIDETSTWQALKQVVAHFPAESDELLPGVKWGSFAQLYTPAFWKLQYLLSDYSNKITSHRLASNIIEEIIMCILGGYGIPSEVGIVAFNRLKDQKLICRGMGFDKIHDALISPFELPNGRQIHYRFYNQKSKYIYKFLNRTDLDEIPQGDDLLLRKWLLSIDGIGLKTASWITRNWLKSNSVAILDIHLLRAGKLAGFFDSDELTDYLQQEKRYLEFCDALQVQASNMDAIIWSFMKKNTKLAVKTIHS